MYIQRLLHDFVKVKWKMEKGTCRTSTQQF